jgi:hypothetical protein
MVECARKILEMGNDPPVGCITPSINVLSLLTAYVLGVICGLDFVELT